MKSAMSTMEVKIECKFSHTGWRVGVSTKRTLYTCQVTSASITKPGTWVAFFKGDHLRGKTNDDVEAINFTNKSVSYIPLGIGKIFPNLKHLEILSCGLREISRRDLIGLESLTGLWLRENALQSLPDNLFNRMKNLTIVAVSDCLSSSLQFFSSKLLRPIMNNNLQIVELVSSSTPRVKFRAGFRTFGSVQELCDYIDSKYEKPDKIAKEYPDHLCRGFKELWASGRLSDFTIVCDLKEFKVHKNILLIQSPVLAAVLESDMEESKTGRMEIKDFTKEAVEDFLKFLYTEETPEETNAMEVLALASKYGVLELKTLMEEIILENIDETSAFEILVLAKQHNCQILIQEALTEIQHMFADMKLDPDLINNLEHLKELIDTKRRYESVLTPHSTSILVQPIQIQPNPYNLLKSLVSLLTQYKYGSSS